MMILSRTISYRSKNYYTVRELDILVMMDQIYIWCLKVYGHSILSLRY